MPQNRRTPEETQELFNQWAATYDQDLQTATNLGPLTGYMHSLDVASALLPVQAGQSVLDIGIGTGAFAERLEKQGATITGIDPSAKMLERCRELHANYQLEIGSFTDIPFEDGQFEAIVASFAFHEVAVDQREAVCQHLVRLLKPNGYVCLVDIIFASTAARENAKMHIGKYWDDTEDYPLVHDLDTYLYGGSFKNVFWQQTALCHWVVLAQK